MKKIGISLRVEIIEKYNERRDSISHDWINFLQTNDCVPILIPNNIDNLENYISDLNLDGIILSGGDNLGDFPERDETENIILKFGIKNSIPILGVCRGMQIINHFFDGKISKNASSSHVGKSHNVEILNSDLIKKFDNSKIPVNSFHNNLIKREDIGNELEIFALAETDNSIEGYFHKNYPIMGVMWHPERTSSGNYQNQIIDIFFNKQIWINN